MPLTDERRDELLHYCRIDFPSERDLVLLESLYSAAVGYMASAGVSLPEPGTERAAQYNLCVNALVLDWWDRREMTIQSVHSVMDNPALRRLMTQLKLTEGGKEAVAHGWPDHRWGDADPHYDL